MNPIVYTSATPANTGDFAARMAGAARVARAREAAAARAARKQAAADAAAAAAYHGHIVAVESDDDYGRHWVRFDARESVGEAIAAGRHIAWLEGRGELSDIDCSA